MLNAEQRGALKVGDEIGVQEQFRVAVLKVSKRTAAQIILSDDSRWTVSRGNKFGSSAWTRETLISAEDARERIKDMQEKKAIRDAANRLERYRWRDLTIEQLQRFNGILDDIEIGKAKTTP